MAKAPLTNDQPQDASRWYKFSQQAVGGVLTLEGPLDPEEVLDLADWLATSPPELLVLNLRGSKMDDAGIAAVEMALLDNTCNVQYFRPI